jgi:HlyD family secretion protein
MKTWQKVTLGIGAVALLGGIVWYSVYQANKGVVDVQTGKVAKADLTSVVTASGEVRPKNFTNVEGEGIGKITEIVVKEGDQVKKGDILLKLENIQPGADVRAQQAQIDSNEAGMRMSSASYDSAVATLTQRQSDLTKAKFDFDRTQKLYEQQLIAKSDYDAGKATFDSATAAIVAAKAQVEQAKASKEQARYNLNQSSAVLTHTQDVLRKTTYVAPIDGIVSYIAVRVGENVVPGIQNAEGSMLMTISDMSVVAAEVKVDETDITNVKVGDPAEVSIDAIPGKTFKASVTQVGDEAILRSSGLAATTQTTANTQEARDFKVVVTIATPPALLRPGLSASAKIQTAKKNGVLTVPIQALAVRTQHDLDEAAKDAKGNVTLAAPKPAAGTAADAVQKAEVQGLFVIRGKKAEFVPVQTGITGVTDIEITNGVKDGDEIVTGSYKALRTLKPGATVKVDNNAPKKDDSAG